MPNRQPARAVPAGSSVAPRPGPRRPRCHPTRSGSEADSGEPEDGQASSAYGGSRRAGRERTSFNRLLKKVSERASVRKVVLGRPGSAGKQGIAGDSQRTSRFSVQCDASRGTFSSLLMPRSVRHFSIEVLTPNAASFPCEAAIRVRSNPDFDPMMRPRRDAPMRADFCRSVHWGQVCAVSRNALDPVRQRREDQPALPRSGAMCRAFSVAAARAASMDRLKPAVSAASSPAAVVPR